MISQLRNAVNRAVTQFVHQRERPSTSDLAQYCVLDRQAPSFTPGKVVDTADDEPLSEMAAGERLVQFAQFNVRVGSFQAQFTRRIDIVDELRPSVICQETEPSGK